MVEAGIPVDKQPEPKPERTPETEWDIWLRDFSAKSEKMGFGTSDISKKPLADFSADLSDLLDLDKQKGED